MYEIEKGVPIPEPVTGSVRRYPIREMKVGDSFLVDDVSDRKKLHRIQSAIWIRARDLGYKVVTRKVAEGIRVWRTA